MKYYYANAANQPVGPIEAEQIARLAAAGVISDQTQVIAEGTQTWMPYAQLRSTINPPPAVPMPPPPPVVRRPLGKGAKAGLIAAAVVIAAAIVGASLWRQAAGRPSRKAIADYVAAAMSHRNFHVQSLTSTIQRTDSGQVRVAYVAQLETLAPFYVPVDTAGYLQEQFGLDANKLAAARLQARSVEPAELAALGPAPADPLSAIIIKPSVPAGSTVTYSGELEATRGKDGWSFAEAEGGQYKPQEPEGAVRSEIQGQTYVVGDASDAAALKALVDQANLYADKVAQAMPADLPAGARTVAKLAKAGVGEDAMLVQVHAETTACPMTTAQILYLSKAGVPQSVIKALLEGPPSAAAESGGSQAEGTPSAATETAPAAPPAQPTVIAVTVLSNVRWVDTGIDLEQGEPVSIAANGAVAVGAHIPLPINIPFFGNRIPVAASNQTPDGDPSAGSIDPFHPYVAPGLPAFSLVGRIGDSAPFEVGSNANFNCPAAGRLFLSVNANSFETNSGFWNVRVTLPPAPPPPPAEPPAQVGFDYFHDQLAPYGNWVQVEGLGWCWNPAVAAGMPGWRPYCDDGQWVFTDQGWFWQSAYPWGDIAFHYGRWYMDATYGWLWVPAYDWAPAWVCWRNAEELGFCGWAPLPPGAVYLAGVGLMWNGRLALDIDFGLGADAFLFLGFDHFWGGDYRHFLVERDRADFLFGRSMILNGYRLDHGRFIVDGLGRDRIGRLTHRQVRAAAARDLRSRDERSHFDARRANPAVRHDEKASRGSERRGPAAAPHNQAGEHPPAGKAPAAKQTPSKQQPAAKPAPSSDKNKKPQQ